MAKGLYPCTFDRGCDDSQVAEGRLESDKNQIIYIYLIEIYSRNALLFE